MGPVALFGVSRFGRFATRARWVGDGGACVAILVLTLLASFTGLRRPADFARGDMFTFWIPMYSFLGDRLRAGDVPGWNPHQFTGAPFAGDPESGWAYLPVMLLFSVLPLAPALAAYSILHLALAGLAAYALGRVLGLGVAGALAAGVAYEFTWFYERTSCCPVFVQVAAWLPLALLAAELALRSAIWWTRLGWWAAAGFAVSQILASWPGQGSYDALLALGGFIAYRALLVPPRRPRAPLTRLGDLALHGGTILTLGFALGAAGMLPRLEANARSAVPQGVYHPSLAAVRVIEQWSLTDLARQILGGYVVGQWWYVGGASLALAIVAPVVARRWFGTPYFAFLAVGAAVLALGIRTPLHAALYVLLPRFEVLHIHQPNRVLVVFYLPVALLAGATVDQLKRCQKRSALLAATGLVPVAALALGIALLRNRHASISYPTQAAVVAAGVLVALYGLVASPPARRLVPAALIVVLFWDPAGRSLSAGLPSLVGRNNTLPVALETYTTRTGAAAFLARAAADDPARYVGYAPALLPPAGSSQAGYLRFVDEPLAAAILVNNRATLLDLDDAQGYNPIQVKRYVEYVAALNGHPQEYHEADVFPKGMGSPLLDLLNVRYLVVPDQALSDDASLTRLVREHPTVYKDGQVRVLENRAALPRAWIVHEARRVAQGETLPPLASGAVDPRRTVLLEAAPPALGAATDPAHDEVTVTRYEPDRIDLRVRTDAPGMVVLSETYDPAWRAEVDGAPAAVYVADHALRAVPVPAGEHVVGLRYESRMLRLGTAISGITLAVLAGFGIFAGWTHRRRRGFSSHGAQSHARVQSGGAVE